VPEVLREFAELWVEPHRAHRGRTHDDHAIDVVICVEGLCRIDNLLRLSGTHLICKKEHPSNGATDGGVVPPCECFDPNKLMGVRLQATATGVEGHGFLVMCHPPQALQATTRMPMVLIVFC
jgi:hypothetical protein